MKETRKYIWSRAAPALGTAGRLLLRLAEHARRLLGLYLDDLLLIGGGSCFVAAADELAGRAWATVVAGACLVAYAIVVAMSRRGGGR